MPTISIFFGIIVRMLYRYTEAPHIHVQYQTYNAILDIATANVIEGKLPIRQARFAQAWVEIHKDDLIANWELCRCGEAPVKLKPLR